LDEYIASTPDAAEFRPRIMLYNAADELELRISRADLLFGIPLITYEKGYEESELYKLMVRYGLMDIFTCTNYLKVFAQCAPLEFISSDAWSLHETLKSIVEAYESPLDNGLLALMQKGLSAGFSARERRKAESVVHVRAKTIRSQASEISELEREFERKDLNLFGKDGHHKRYSIFEAKKVADTYFRQSGAQGKGFAERPPIRGARDSRIVSYWLGVFQKAVGLSPVGS
jgi:hypothetical protein